MGAKFIQIPFPDLAPKDAILTGIQLMVEPVQRLKS